MPIINPAFLPAAFGLLGTIVGGLLTMMGQVRADRRAQEKRSEEHYATLATELIEWRRRRSQGMAEAMSLTGEASRAKVEEFDRQYPLSDFVLRIQTSFPELEGQVVALMQAELETMAVLEEIGREDKLFGSVDEKARRSTLERWVLFERPVLAALAEARRQVTVHRPRRLDIKRIVGMADQQADELSGFLKRRG